MEGKRFIVDGPTLVNNIHFIKFCVYNGFLKIHVPICATESVDILYKKSIEPKEQPKVEKPKRWSGKPRREQQPLFDINPRTAVEFLQRAKEGDGIAGVSVQIENEVFSPWNGDHKAQETETKPSIASNSHSEALLRMLNIKGVSEPKDKASDKPKLPAIPKENVPKEVQPLLSCVLWKLHECRPDPPETDGHELLCDDATVAKHARAANIAVLSGRELRDRVMRALALADKREDAGELEGEFPKYERRQVPPPERKLSTAQQSTPKANGSLPTNDENERALEAVALSVVQGLDCTDQMDPTSEQQLKQIIAAELKPSISYAMAAGSTSAMPVKALLPPAPQQQLSMDGASESVIQKVEVAPPVEEAPKMAEPAVDATNDEIDSDEEVVVFNPKARQASNKRKSREVARPPSATPSRPVTANGATPVGETASAGGPTILKQNSPRPSSLVMKSVLKPDSPIFSPRQPLTNSSPMLQSSSLTSPTFAPMQVGSPGRRTSPPQRASTTSPQTQSKQPPSGPKHSRKGAGARQVNQEAAQRQSEIILQRQREAIRRSTETKETKATTEGQETAEKPMIQVEMRPTNNPVVLDPDEFGRRYVIAPGARADTSPRARADGGRRRGGRGRGGRGQQQQQDQQQAQQPASTRANGDAKDVDFVLRSGQPRSTARGQGKLWVP